MRLRWLRGLLMKRMGRGNRIWKLKVCSFYYFGVSIFCLGEGMYSPVVGGYNLELVSPVTWETVDV